ncbi:MAG: RimJ/RimL family protein N-acetyltransferase [Myxococcota bacterium]|jgi:RimJ/RimL family protein N-acetyltransferase
MPRIPDETLRALARTFVSQGQGYGFEFADYVRFVNVMLDEAMGARPVQGSARATALPLVGESVTIRALEPADRACVLAWVTDPEGRYFLLSRSTGRRSDAAQLLDDPHNVFGVVTRPDGRPIGVIGYLDVDPAQGRGELRKLIGDPGERGKGRGTEAARLWVSYGVHRLKLRKILLYTLAANQRNVQLNERLGFRVEGVLRDEVVIDGTPHDLLRMGRVEPVGT